MAWVDFKRLPSKLSGSIGEPMKLIATWEIRVDDPETDEFEILQGVTGTIGITWGTPHWSIPSLRVADFDLSPSARNGMIWILTVTYTVIPPKKDLDENGRPPDVWEQSGGATTVPGFTDRDGEITRNSAGDPLEGLEKERQERGWTLTKYYDDDASLKADLDAYDGKLNDDTWDGGEAKTWKCYYQGSKKITISRLDGSEDGGELEFIEARWEFRYDPETWVAKPWDVGFHELVGSGEKVAIVGADGKTVKQPVALDPDGTARAPGDPPLVVNGGDGIDFYFEADFDAGFGPPFMIEAGS